MTDSILAARLESLKENLERLRQSIQLVERVPLAEASAEELLDYVGREIDEEAHYARLEINRIGKLLTGSKTTDDAAQAWEEFTELEAKTHALFGNCLELIGGVAFREKGKIDEDVWRVADAFNLELCRQALKQSFNYLTVPALEEGLGGSMVRTIRLRFPEWTLWSLPLVGYEFGHAGVKSRSELEDLVERHAKRLAEAAEAQLRSDPEQAVAAGSDPDQTVAAGPDLDQAVAAGPDPGEAVAARRRSYVERAAMKRVRVLLADAVATFMLGPCYACATIYLRLDPVIATVGSEASPEERARVILTCLREMDKENDSARSEFVEALEEQWREATARSRAPADKDPARLADLEETILPDFIDALLYLPRAARLTASGWQQAIRFELEWLDQLKASDPLRLQLAPTDQLREILNAAWLTRRRMPDHTARIETAAIASCLDLLETRRKRARRRGSRTPGKEPPR